MLQKIFYWASIAPSGIYVLIVGRLDVDGQSFASIGLHQTGTASASLLIKRHCISMKACREFNFKINRITKAVGKILALTGKKMLLVI